MCNEKNLAGHVDRLTTDVSTLRKQLAEARAEIDRLKKERKKRSPKDDFEHKRDTTTVADLHARDYYGKAGAKRG